MNSEHAEAWSPPQQALVDVVLGVWSKHSRWPTYDYVAGVLEEQGFDVTGVLRSFPEWGEKAPTAGRYGDVVYEHTYPWPRDDSLVSLSIRGLAKHPVGLQAAELFVATLRLAAARWKELPHDPSGVKKGQLTRAEVAALLRRPVQSLSFVGALLSTEFPPGITGLSRDPEEGEWTAHFDRRITRYVDADVQGYLLMVRDRYEEGSTPALDAPSEPWSADMDTVQFMQPSRAIEELRRLLETSNGPEVRLDGPAHKAWRSKVVAVLERSLGAESSILRDFRGVRYHIGVYTGAPGEAERDALYFANQVDSAAAYIEAAIYELELAVEPAVTLAVPEGLGQTGASDHSDAGVVFLVHGHDEAAKHEVARFLQQATGSAPVILHEQANQGQTLVEKFERHAGQAIFSVVLLTPDDVGRSKEDDQDQPRARQNVVFELGYFFGKLGRGCVAVLNAGVDKPSDVDGLVYISYPNSNWKLQLAKELQAAGVRVDLDGLLN